ncbi:Phosphatidylinositol 4-kinase gamma 7 [Vitis vinifera]|uniref:1-phosphatidylinositol 4-kinase n=1 Tax=Vitis vinifera TaxID=29760 RepID=A0A438IMP8_VITVI|nr:Phosphatidylinositol 4-kinase gamma 7 [Vitis vinifera]
MIVWDIKLSPSNTTALYKLRWQLQPSKEPVVIALKIRGWKENLSARRRVFVQTETGSVLGIELDRSDNAYTVKKRLQLALNIPTEESSLTYGDTVLKNDLSAVRHDSPLLLTRKFLHRSSSTPCLSPTGRIFSREIRVVQLRYWVGLEVHTIFRNCNGENVAIVKPTDEEPFAPNNPKGWVGKTLGQPGLKRSVRVGETGFREVAAYLLDYDHFSNVPSTALVKITHSIFNVNDRVNGNMNQNGKQVSKIASLQQFIQHDFDASDHGTSSFTVSAVHRIGILDIRILNTDRHAGNLLVRKLDGFEKFGQVELVPIDHGLCLPESLEDPYFEWIHWPQASIPFSEDELEYIDNLDPIHDSDMLRMELPMIREACLRVLVLCTTFLKEAAAFGLCLAEIGEMMSREFQAHKGDPSELEVICIEARRQLEEMEVLALERKVREEEFQFDMDCEDEEFDLIPSKEEKLVTKTTSHFGFTSANGRNPLSKLEENVEDEAAAEIEGNGMLSQVEGSQVPSALKLSLSLENTKVLMDELNFIWWQIRVGGLAVCPVWSGEKAAETPRCCLEEKKETLQQLEQLEIGKNESERDLQIQKTEADVSSINSASIHFHPWLEAPSPRLPAETSSIYGKSLYYFLRGI